MQIMGELLLFMKQEKKWWIAPFVVTLGALSAVVVFAESSSVAPFIYALF